MRLRERDRIAFCLLVAGCVGIICILVGLIVLEPKL